MGKIIFTLIVIFAFSCNMISSEQTSNEQMINMPGAYSLQSKNIKGSTADSVAGGVNKLKIYTEDYFMYAAMNTLDSVASFGIGSYTKEGKKITEHMLFSAHGTSSFKPADFILDINKTPEGYEHIIKDSSTIQGEMVSYIEKYNYVGSKTKSIIDGAWKQIETYAVKDKDTTWDKGSNVKICYDGYVIWGDFHMNPAIQKQDTYMGFGTIETKGKNQVKEFYIKSNYTVNEGKAFYIDVEFRNKDVFKQTILDSLTGTRYIEVYQRLNIQ